MKGTGKSVNDSANRNGMKIQLRTMKVTGQPMKKDLGNWAAKEGRCCSPTVLYY